MVKSQKQAEQGKTRITLHPLCIPVGVSIILFIITIFACFINNNKNAKTFLLTGVRSEQVSTGDSSGGKHVRSRTDRNGSGIMSSAPDHRTPGLSPSFRQGQKDSKTTDTHGWFDRIKKFFERITE